MQQNYPIFLASKSPRRREILSIMGLTFTVVSSDADEVTSETEPEKLVEELSLRKALGTRVTDPEAMVIGSDTVVSYAGRILGKPKDEEEAFSMLKMLSGNVSSVYTGVTLFFPYKDKPPVTFHTRTEVVFDTLTDAEILSYIKTGEPMDKAGAYGIQGTFGKHIIEIRGDYYNVMGLPMHDLYKKLKEENIIFI
ncbi:MAG: Maf family protein [Lachnospiraceae bacterium]|nr:Maf family protein [Lachnospiraceae bacterium]